MRARDLYRREAPVARSTVLGILLALDAPLAVPSWLALRHYLAAAEAGRPLAEVAWVLWLLGAVMVVQMLGVAAALVARWEVRLRPGRLQLRLHPLPPRTLSLEHVERIEHLPGPPPPPGRLFLPWPWAGAALPERGGESTSGILVRTIAGRAWLLQLPDPDTFLAALEAAGAPEPGLGSYRKLPVATSSTTPSTTRKTTTRLRAGTP